MKIAIGCDHGGITLKDSIVNYLEERGVQIEDFGTFGTDSVDYPDFAYKVARSVADGKADKGILMCGTGIGISIAANKVNGIRCALCHNTDTAKLTAMHNDSNVLAMGGRVIDADTAVNIVKAWLDTPFEGGRHINRINKISEIEKKEKNN